MNDQTEPLSIKVPLGCQRETDLMAALECVIENFYLVKLSAIHVEEVARAVDWLHAKYGNHKATGTASSGA